MKLTFTTIDVFTKTRYEGNPLAIVHVPANDDDALTQAKKQKIAQEFNLSETVFLHLRPSGSGDEPTKIDIFTPDTELPFAGHPTIGIAWYLLQHQSLPISALQTKAGPIPIARQDDHHVRATIPHNIHTHSHAITSSSGSHPLISIVQGVTFILASVPTLSALSSATHSLHPNAHSTSILDPGWQTGLIGTLYYTPDPEPATTATTATAYRTRMHIHFEDPATGSASAALAAYLALREPAARGRGPFVYVLTQGVEMGRRSRIGVEVVRKERVRDADADAGADEGRWEVESVVLSGGAVSVMQGVVEV